jgi:hypothetical protein
MDATLLKSITNGYKDVTAFGLSSVSYEPHWFKIYGAGVILYHTSDKSYFGTYRATLDGATWGTFQQTTFEQPDPGELAARAWIDQNTPVMLTPVPVTTNTVTNVSNTLGISTAGLLIGVAVLIIIGVALWPRRKTVFDRRRK